jgi:Type II secretion system (T2SS), protein G
MRHNAPKVLLALVLSVLSACWIPEQFVTKVTINNDGSYTFSYDGILTFGLALAAAKEGKLTAKDEQSFKAEAAKLSKEPGFKKVSYLGKGRYKVFVEYSGLSGQPYYFLSKDFKLFDVVPQPDGTVAISAVRPDKKTLEQLASIGATIEGTLSVSVARGATVVKHNAESTPVAFGLFGDYKWQIKSPAANPFIVIRPGGSRSTEARKAQPPERRQGKAADSKEAAQVTMKDIRSIATACEAFSVDHNRYPDAKAIDTLAKLISPIYLRICPQTDGWGHRFEYYVSPDGQNYRIISGGADGHVEPGSRQIGSRMKGATASSSADIVFENGQYVQYPEGANK